MRIIEVIDSPWAIGALAKRIARDNFPKHTFKVVTIHPKDYRRDPDGWNGRFVKEVIDFQPDVIHFHYWDTAYHLANIPDLANVKKILTHHNQKNLLSHDWSKFDHIAVHTQKAKTILNEAGYLSVTVIQHGIDIEQFPFKEKLEEDNRLLGYTGRIVPWKGLKDILITAQNIGTEVLIMGKIDKADYWNECLGFSDNMDIAFNTPTEDQPKKYHEMACYIGNSSDGIEEGTLGLLEAMACGIPVITTPSGEAKDIIEDGVNGLIVNFDDQEDLERKVRFFFSMRMEEREAMREKAWDTVRNLDSAIMARKYESLYNSVIFDKDLVSVIIPTSGRAEYIRNLIKAYDVQTYKNIELVIVVDEKNPSRGYEDEINEARHHFMIPIRLEYTYSEGYGIAKARNIGMNIASGNYLIFNDDRFLPEPDAVEMFVKRISGVKDKTAIWGEKNGKMRPFIENFFIVRRKHIIQAGGFNERIDEYGGQSQEIRTRLLAQGFILSFEPTAKAKQQFGTKSKKKKRYQVLHSKVKLWIMNN